MHKLTYNPLHYTIAVPNIDTCIAVTHLQVIKFSDGQLTKIF